MKHIVSVAPQAKTHSFFSLPSPVNDENKISSYGYADLTNAAAPLKPAWPAAQSALKTHTSQSKTHGIIKITIQ